MATSKSGQCVTRVTAASKRPVADSVRKRRSSFACVLCVCHEIHNQITTLVTVYVRGEAVLRVYRVCQEIHTQITTLVTQCT